MSIVAMRKAIAGLVLAAGLSGCAVTLLSQYDLQTDQTASSIQKKLTAQAATMSATYGTPDCVYDKYAAGYQDLRVDLSALKLRVGVIANNEPTVAAVNELDGAIQAFESLHKLAGPKCMSPQEIAPALRGIDSTVGAVLKLELAKKRGS